MALPSVNLNVRANTARAMADFKKFSDSLNNKFLVSGLKVDLISATLRQINSELQKSIGEQGLLGSSSMRAAQNQAALLTATFKGFGLEASKSINENMTKALSNVAVKAGGTVADIKKVMAAAPFISTNLSPEERTAMAKQMLSFQRDLRRSGVSEEFGNLGQKFLSGQTTVGDMVNSMDPLASSIGMTMMRKYGASIGTIYNAEARTRILQEVLNDPEINAFLKEQSKKTFGFRTYIEGLNTYLFNPESGVFGSLKKVKMSAYRTTTIFDETDKLIASIFGPEGVFLKFFKTVGKTFGVGDPLRVVIMGMDFLRKQVGNLSNFITSPFFQQILGFAKTVFDTTFNIFKSLYERVTSYNWAGLLPKGFNLPGAGGGPNGGGGQGPNFNIDRYLNRPYITKDITGGNYKFDDLFNGTIFNSDTIKQDAKKIGESFRKSVEEFSKKIRSTDISGNTKVPSSVMGILVEEVGKSIGTIIRESFFILINKIPEILKYSLPEITKAINKIIDTVFGPISGIVKILAMLLPGRLGMFARGLNAASAFGGGAGSWMGLLGIGAAAFFPQLRTGALDAGRSRAIEWERYKKFEGSGGFFGRFAPQGYFNRRLFWARTGRWGKPPGGGGPGGTPTPPPTGAGRVTTSLYDYLPPDLNATNPRYGVRTPADLTANQRRELILRKERFKKFKEAQNAAPYWASHADDNWAHYNHEMDELGNLSVTDMQGNPAPGRQEYVEGSLGDYNERYKGRGDILEANTRSNRRLSMYNRKRNRFRRWLKTSGRRIASPFKKLRKWTGENKTKAGLIVGGAVLGGLAIASLFSGAKAAGLDEQTQAQLDDPETAAMLDAARNGDAGAAEELKARGISNDRLYTLKGQRKKQLEGEKQSAGVSNFLGGAANGAMMGMMFGPWGALIGGVLGAGASLMDKGTRDAVGKFVGGMWDSFKGFIRNVKNWLVDAAVSVGNGIKAGLITVVNLFLDNLMMIPRILVGVAQKIADAIPDRLKPGFLKDGLKVASGIVNYKVPGGLYYDGLNSSGSALALEERMSGGRSFIANSNEIVIGRSMLGGFTDLVEQKVRRSMGPQEIQPRIELVINVNNPVMLGSNKELLESLRKPVIDIINDAYKKSVTGVRSRPMFIT